MIEFSETKWLSSYCEPLAISICCTATTTGSRSLISNLNQSTESAGTLGHKRRHGLKSDREEGASQSMQSRKRVHKEHGKRRSSALAHQFEQASISESNGNCDGVWHCSRHCTCTRRIQGDKTLRSQVTTALHVAGRGIALHNACCAHRLDGNCLCTRDSRWWSGVDCGVECNW